MVLLLQWGILFITFPFMVVIGGKYVFACYVFAIFFHLSGHFVIIPGACTRIFGPGNMATIYGLVYATTVCNNYWLNFIRISIYYAKIICIFCEINMLLIVTCTWISYIFIQSTSSPSQALVLQFYATLHEKER